MQSGQLQKQIMRRVYYTYVVQAVCNPLVGSGAVFVFALWLFGRLVHVARIVETLRMKHLPEVPGYLLEAFEHTDVFTVSSVVLMLGAVGYALWYLYQHRQLWAVEYRAV